MLDSSDIKALIKVVALAISGDTQKADEITEWAYSSQEKPNRASPQKKEDKSEAVMRVYEAYPANTTRPEGNKVTLRTSKDKEKIKRLLKTKTEEELTDAIKRYVAETNPQYLKMFGTFLNNMPDYQDAGTIPEEPSENAIFQSPEMTKYMEERRKYYNE